MHIPSWVSRATARVWPDARIAWKGRPRRHADELNPGSFCLVQLFHRKHIGPLESPWSYETLWDVHPVLNDAGSVVMESVTRGPIYAADGSSRRDWDPLFYVPVFIADFEVLGYSNQEVCDGVFLPHIGAWRSKAKDRAEAEKRRRYKEAKDYVDGWADEAGDFLWREANRTDSKRLVVPKEDRLRAAKEYWESRDPDPLATAMDVK